jgi:hypothetical protein
MALRSWLTTPLQYKLSSETDLQWKTGLINVLYPLDAVRCGPNILKYWHSNMGILIFDIVTGKSQGLSGLGLVT